MSTPATTLQPKGFGGDGREPGVGDQEFISFCPPDVQPRTRIIALCGVNDWHNNASPQEDGWLLSDFYLFHYLLKDTRTFRSSNQLWFTCVEPRCLISKYKEYVHGSRSGDCRIVLDAKELQEVEKDNTLRVIPSKDLLERFLATLKSETQIAAWANQQVLVLVFGHGEEGNYGAAIGGQGSSLDAPRLTRQRFNAAIHPGVDLNLFITSCYSGGWLVKPMMGSFLSSMKKMNINRMTTVSENEMSRAWANSASCGRAGGSIYAAAVFNALVEMSEINAADEEMTSSPTYLNLCNSVYQAYKESDPFSCLHGISFSAQDDKWNSEWRTRSGFPLLDYREKWERLQQVSSKDPAHGPSAFSPDATLGFTGSIGRGYHNVVKAKAKYYLDSFPGPDNVGPNVIHYKLKQLIQGAKFSEDLLIDLNNTLDYRLSAMQLASQYVSFLDLQFTDGLMFDTERWINGAALEDAKHDRSVHTVTRLMKFKKVQGCIIDKKLFDRPASTQGWSYHKPRDYLAIALVESSLSYNEICNHIDRLNRLKIGAQSYLVKMPIGENIMSNKEVVRHRDKLYATWGKFRSRLRSLSPRSARKPLPS